MLNQVPTREPLSGDRIRQACDSLGGYAYQIWLSVLTWLDLTGDECIYLEGAEDIDLIRNDLALSKQVKRLAATVTLRSQAILDAIVNSWRLRKNNPGRRLTYQFITTAEIGQEQGAPFGKGERGLEIWEAAQRCPETAAKLIAFLQGITSFPTDFLEYLRETDKATITTDLIANTAWVTGSQDVGMIRAEINRKLTLLGETFRILPDESHKVAPWLFEIALDRACTRRSGPLDRQQLLEKFQERVTERVPKPELSRLRALEHLSNANWPAQCGSGLPISLQPYNPIQNGVPTFHTTIASRTPLVETALKTLAKTGYLFIVGSVGMGKTTLAKQIAGRSGVWVWLNLSTMTPQLVPQILTVLGAYLEAHPEIDSVTIDDIDMSPDATRIYEESLGGLFLTIRARKKRVIVTSQRPPTGRLTQGLGLRHEATLDVPYLLLEDINELLSKEQHPGPATRQEELARCVIMQTQGHPQLVQSRVYECKRSEWPILTAKDYLTTPPDVARAREELRQTLSRVLSHEQKELLYRLTVAKTFRRDHAIELGRSVPIPMPGDEFDSLVGPYIERLSPTYYRTSALLDGAAKEVWGAPSMPAIHSSIAECLLTCDNFSTLEAQDLLLHGLSGKNIKAIILAVRAIVTAPEELRNQLFTSLEWVRLLGRDGQPIYADNATCNAFLRMLQFKMTVGIDPARAAAIFSYWDAETNSEPVRELKVVLRFMYAFQVLLHPQVPVPIEHVVQCMVELVTLSEEARDIKDQLQSACKNGAEPLGLPPTDDFLQIFTLFLTMRHLSGLELRLFLQTVEQQGTDVQSRILSLFALSPRAATMLVAQAWLTVADSPAPQWHTCIEELRDIRTVAERLQSPNLIFATAHAIAVIYDEYLHQSNRALAEIDEIQTKYGPSVILDDEHAMVLYGRKDYGSALSLWERVLEAPANIQEEAAASLLTVRKAAMCAGYSGNWGKAAKLFDMGRARPKPAGMIWFNAAFRAETGVAYWKAGEVGKAIDAFFDTLILQDQLPPSSEDLRSFCLGKHVGNALTWMTRTAEGEKPPPSVSEPEPGAFTDPVPNERLKELPPPNQEYSWCYLATLECGLTLNTKVLDYTTVRLGACQYIASRLFLTTARFRHALRTKQYRAIPTLAHELGRLQSLLSEGDCTSAEQSMFIKLDPTKLSGELTQNEIDAVELFLFQTLIHFFLEGNGQQVLEQWRTGPFPSEATRAIAPFLDCASRIMKMSNREARQVMLDRSGGWLDRTLAALNLAIDDQTDIAALFLAQTFLFPHARARYFGNEACESLAKSVSSRWQDVTRLPALLRTPAATVPAILRACHSSLRSERKIADIFLATADAITLSIPPETRQEWRNIRDAKAKDSSGPTA